MTLGTRSRLRPAVLGLTLCFFGSLCLAPRPAQAMSRDVRAVLVISTYGLVGGTLLGLAALPFNQDARTIFIGSSLGLYLGIAVGLYYVYDRHQQEEQQPGGHRLGLLGEPSSPDERLRKLASFRMVGGFEAAPQSAPMKVEWPVLRF